MKLLKIMLCCIIICASLLCSCDEDSIQFYKSMRNQDISDTIFSNESTELVLEDTPVIFDSVSDLTKAINNAKIIASLYDYDIISFHRLVSVDNLYIPNIEFNDYRLYRIEVTEYRLRYYFMPSKLFIENAEDMRYDPYEGIEIVFALPIDIVDSNDPLRPLIDQTRLSLTEDGYLYDWMRSYLYIPINGTWMAIYVPDKYNDYDTIKSICPIDTIEIIDFDID